MKVKRFLATALTVILTFGMVVPSFTMAMEVEEDAGLESNNGITPEDTEPSTNTDVEEEEREVAPAEIEFFGGSPTLFTDTKTIHFDIKNLGLGSTVNAYVYIKNQATGMEYTEDFELGHGEIKSIDWNIPTCGVYTAYLYNNGQCVSNEWSGVLPHIIGDTRKANIVEPTCTEEGRYDVEYQCSTCSEWLILESDARMAELGHQMEDAPQLDPTCTEAGHKAYSVCTRDACNYAVDENGTPIDNLDTWLAEGGDGYIAPTGHTPGEVVIENVIDATCQQPGSRDEVIYCTECGEELARNTAIIPQLMHITDKVVIENYVEPTAKQAGGYDEVLYCTLCNKEVSRTHVTIPATGYSISKVEYKYLPDTGVVFIYAQDATVGKITTAITITKYEQDDVVLEYVMEVVDEMNGHANLYVEYTDISNPVLQAPSF